MIIHIFWLLLIIYVALARSIQYKTCSPRSFCSCETVDGVIDLHPLGNKDRNPRFTGIIEPKGIFTFSWNPCYSFNEKACQNVSICQYDKIRGDSFTLGTHNSIEYTSQDGVLLIEYSADTDIQRTSDIKIICDPTVEGRLQFIAESPPTFYHFELVSRYGCPVPRSQSLHFMPVASPMTNRKEGRSLSTHLIPSMPSSNDRTVNTITLIFTCIVVMVMLVVLLSLMGIGLMISRHTNLHPDTNILQKYYYQNTYRNSDKLDCYTK
ncbi:hypothetical protein SNE40_022868 [Patella caerulea]|uniref:MRH domain-containing protein n=1 Tax=Patella caerulea TaxID=87958 RepID=A0AAN8J413_PATCE